VNSYKFQVSDLSIHRNGRELINDVNFNLVSGNCCMVHGANGVGKSTFLRAIAGLRPSFGGSIVLKKDKLDSELVFTDLVCYQGHKSGISLNLTVLDNIYFFASIYKTEPSDLDHLINQFSLNELLNKSINALSAGEQKRVSIVTTFLKKAKLWILDEPSINLDTAGCAALNFAITERLNNGSIFILATHHLDQFKSLATHQLQLGET
jgi:heme exporter protein A